MTKSAIERLRGLAKEFTERGDTSRLAAEFLPDGQAAAARGAAGAYREAARLLNAEIAMTSNPSLGRMSEHRTTALHELKVWPREFAALADGSKPFEWRSTADRDFRLGDRLLLMEWNPETQRYKGTPALRRKITYILEGPSFGVPEGYAVLGLGDHS